MTPGDLAGVMEVVPSTVSKWRAGRIPGGIHLRRIGTLLGVRTNWLRTGEGERLDPDMPGWDDVIADGGVVPMRAIEAAVVQATAEFVPYLVKGSTMPVREALGILDRLSTRLGAKRPDSAPDAGEEAAGNEG